MDGGIGDGVEFGVGAGGLEVDGGVDGFDLLLGFGAGALDEGTVLGLGLLGGGALGGGFLGSGFGGGTVGGSGFGSGSG